jgi:YVTN family beta-propeller protein
MVTIDPFGIRKSARCVQPAMAVGLLLALTTAAIAQNKPAPRRPIDIVTVSDHLFVANRDSGTISEISTTNNVVLRENRVGRRLASLVATDDGQYLLATDTATHHVHLIQTKTLDVTSSMFLPAAPVSICSVGKNRWAIACLWARQVCFIELDAKTKWLTLNASVDLPFAPNRLMHWPAGNRLIAADSFGGLMASIDTASRKVMAVVDTECHNIRGLALHPDGKSFSVSHQMLNEAVPTQKQRVFWGTLLQNIVRTITFKQWANLEHEAATANKRVTLHRWSLVTVGDVKKAAADPGDLLRLKSGRLAVAIAGIHEVGLAIGNDWQHVPVGKGPRALAEGSNGRLYVVCTFDDSVAVVDPAKAKTIATISLGTTRPPTDIQRGEQLFHDGRLTLDGWFSCHSCHTDGHTNGLSNDNFGDETFFTSKQIPSLLGTHATGPWGWLGNKPTLASQITASITSTMHGKPLNPGDQKALIAYIQTLTPPPPLNKARGKNIGTGVARGKIVFDSRNCTDCHKKPAWTSKKSYDVGLIDEQDARKFNPPTLLGVSQRPRFLHDGRAATLADVFGQHAHENAEEPMTPQQLSDLITYLNSL